MLCGRAKNETANTSEVLTITFLIFVSNHMSYTSASGDDYIGFVPRDKGGGRPPKPEGYYPGYFPTDRPVIVPESKTDAQMDPLWDSWNVKNLDYEIHILAKAYERGLNARWNFFGKRPGGTVVYDQIIRREKRFTVLDTGYLIVVHGRKQTIIPYSKYDPFHGKYETLLVDGQHNYLHLVNRHRLFVYKCFV